MRVYHYLRGEGDGEDAKALLRLGQVDALLLPGRGGRKSIPLGSSFGAVFRVVILITITEEAVEGIKGTLLEKKDPVCSGCSLPCMMVST